MPSAVTPSEPASGLTSSFAAPEKSSCASKQQPHIAESVVDAAEPCTPTSSSDAPQKPKEHGPARRIGKARKRHACSMCGKVFSKRSNMLIHERLHTGEMPYMCRFEGCGKKYKWLSSINFHEKRCALAPEAPATVLSKPRGSLCQAKLEQPHRRDPVLGQADDAAIQDLRRGPVTPTVPSQCNVPFVPDAGQSLEAVASSQRGVHARYADQATSLSFAHVMVPPELRTGEPVMNEDTAARLPVGCGASAVMFSKFGDAFTPADSLQAALARTTSVADLAFPASLHNAPDVSGGASNHLPHCRSGNTQRSRTPRGHGSTRQRGHGSGGSSRAAVSPRKRAGPSGNDRSGAGAKRARLAAPVLAREEPSTTALGPLGPRWHPKPELELLEPQAAGPRGTSASARRSAMGEAVLQDYAQALCVSTADSFSNSTAQSPVATPDSAQATALPPSLAVSAMRGGVGPSRRGLSGDALTAGGQDCGSGFDAGIPMSPVTPPSTRPPEGEGGADRVAALGPFDDFCLTSSIDMLASDAPMAQPAPADAMTPAVATDALILSDVLGGVTVGAGAGLISHEECGELLSLF